MDVSSGTRGMSADELRLLKDSKLLKESTLADTYFGSALQNYAAEQIDRQPAEEIAHTEERLRLLKYIFTEVATKQIFLENLVQYFEQSPGLFADGHQLPATSVHELAALELAAGREKIALKKSKDARADAEKKLEQICVQVAHAFTENNRMREDSTRIIDNALAEENYQQVVQTLKSRSDQGLQTLAEKVDSLDARSCEYILTETFDEVTAVKREEEAIDAEIAALQTQLDALVREKDALEQRLVDKRTAEAKDEELRKHAQNLRTEAADHEALYNTLSALTRTKICSFDEREVVIEVIVRRPIAGVAAQDERTADVTYRLEMTITSLEEGLVTALRLEPPDIDLASSVSRDRPRTVFETVQQVIGRLHSTSPVEK